MAFQKCIKNKFHVWRPNGSKIEIEDETNKDDLVIEIPVICIVCQYEAIGSFGLSIVRDIENDDKLEFDKYI